MSRAIKALLAVAGLLVAGMLLFGGEDPYRVKLTLDQANGLRGGSQQGSEVRVGGAPAGRVSSLTLGPDEKVIAELELKPEISPIGRDASVDIISANLVGEKIVSLRPGDRSQPMKTGASLPEDRVKTQVDLDQVLDVLDADTRARLQVLVNEAGLAVSGRKADFAALLDRLPPTLSSATALLNQVVADNRTLGAVIDRGDRLVASLAGQRRELGELVGATDTTMGLIRTRRAELAETLERAPGTLRSLQGLLADLRVTAQPLGPAARALSATADPLRATLDEIPTFTRRATPALEQAVDTAPRLAELGREATPIVRRANPVVRQTRALSRDLQPVSDTLDAAFDDALAVLEGWPRAIQGRDALSHVFRGKVAIGSESLRSLTGRFDPPAARSAPDRADAPRPVTPAPAPAAGGATPGSDAGPAAGGAQPGAPRPVLPLLDQVASGLGQDLDELVRPQPAPSAAPTPGDQSLLDYLLGP